MAVSWLGALRGKSTRQTLFALEQADTLYCGGVGLRGSAQRLIGIETAIVYRLAAMRGSFGGDYRLVLDRRGPAIVAFTWSMR
jgi:hypothetical protein